MNRPKLRLVIQGMAMAVMAAYIYAVLIGLMDWRAIFGSSDSTVEQLAVLLFFIPCTGMLVTWWFVLPIGAILALAISRTVHNTTRMRALASSAMLGVGVGLIIVVLAQIAFNVLPLLLADYVNWSVWWNDLFSRALPNSALIVPYSAVWVVCYAQFTFPRPA